MPSVGWTLSAVIQKHTHPETERDATVLNTQHTLSDTDPGRPTKNVFPKSFSCFLCIFPLTSLLSALSPLLSHPPPNQETRLAWGWHKSPIVNAVFYFPTRCLFPVFFHGWCEYLNVYSLIQYRLHSYMCAVLRNCLFCDSQLLTFYLVTLHIQNYWINVKLCIVFLFTLIEGVLQWISMLCGLQEKLKLQRLRYLDF